ncbi:ribonuclease H-like domain-containing protein [Tanacetum coccineum]
MADEEVPTDMALMAFSDSEVHNDKTCSKTCLKSFETLKTQLDDLRIEFTKSEFNLATYKRGLASVEEQLVFYKKNEVLFCKQLVVLKRNISYKDSEISMLKSELEKLKQERENNQLKIENFDNTSKSLDKLIGSQILDKSRKGLGFVSYNVVPPPPTGLFSLLNLDLSNSSLEEFQQRNFDHVHANYNYHQRERMVSGNNYTKMNYNYSAKKVYPSAHRNIVPRAVLMKTGPRPLNTARHMTGNMSYLSNFKEFDRGYVTFGGGDNRGRITGKGTLKTGKLDFEDVYFVKELQFNLFSVSHMCDKKNSVRFTDTGCFVLSPNFKLADESQVLLKFHRKNNMYSVDMKNIVLKESLAYLVTKATLDESMLWHRRLGHVNFKTINKLVKDNLVKENLVDKKVKIIRCDNETKIKNRVMSEFCEKKGIKREFSVARTPQQNGVAERRNRTLIEAARTIGRTPSLSYMRPFGCHVTILNTLDYLGKFNGMSDDGFFIGYSFNSKAFRVYNNRTRKVEENLHVRFLEDKPIIAGDGLKWLFDIDVLTKSMNYVPVVAGTNSNDFVGTKESIGAGHTSKEPGSRKDYILMRLWKNGSLFDSSPKNTRNDEPQPSSDAGKKDDDGGIDNQEGLENITTAPLKATHADFFGDETRLDISNITNTYLVPTTLSTRIHKDHSLDHVIRNGYTQEEGIDYDEVFAPVARIEAIRLFLAYASFKDFVVYQMDMKSAFIYGKIEEEVYVCQPLGFEDPEFLDKVYKDKYVDEILKMFGFSTVKTASTPMETLKPLFKDAKAEDAHLYRSMIGSLMYLTAYRPDIMFGVCACARFQVTPKVSHLHAVKRIFRYLKGQPKLGIWYLKDSSFDLEAYTDSNYAGASLDKRSTIGGCQFIGRKLISWQCKKQTIVSNSPSEVEYVAASIKNPVFHSKTKHIEIRHHFIRDSNEKKLIQMIKIHTDHNVAYLFTKAFDVRRFQYLIATANDKIQVSTIGLPYYWYALTKNPTIYVSLIKKFWQTATVRTVANGKQEITTIVDGKEFTVTEASIRRHLQLADVDELILNVVSSSHQKSQTPRKALNKVTKLPQTSEPIPNVLNEAVYEEWDDRVERVTITAASLDVEQASESRKLGADLKQTKQVYGAAYTKLIMKVKRLKKIVKTSHSRRSYFGYSYTGRRLTYRSVGSSYTAGASMLVSTVSGGISTTGASMPVSTAKRLGHEAAVRLQEELDEEERQRMAIVHEAAQYFTKEEWENIRARVEADEELAQRL